MGSAIYDAVEALADASERSVLLEVNARPANEPSLAFHDRRLELCLAGLGSGPVCAADIAKTLGWTRHETPYGKLDEFARGMAAMETKAHLDLLVARGRATRSTDADGVVWYSATP